MIGDFALTGASAFQLFIKPLVNAWTWDQDSIDRGCIRVIGPSGNLKSFSRYCADGGAVAQ